MTNSLLTATLALLEQTSRESWPALAQDIGCTYTWLAQLDKGLIKDPSVNKIQKLYEKLSGKPLVF
jgi:predicted transcriptional regulator